MKGLFDKPPAIAVVAIGLIIVGLSANQFGAIFGIPGAGNFYLTLGLLIVGLIAVIYVLSELAK